MTVVLYVLLFPSKLFIVSFTMYQYNLLQRFKAPFTYSIFVYETSFFHRKNHYYDQIAIQLHIHNPSVIQPKSGYRISLLNANLLIRNVHRCYAHHENLSESSKSPISKSRL